MKNTGRLKIFIGYAPGVGKTYAMLNEANRRLKRGQDIVIGYVESHQRKETDNQIGGLEIIPRKKSAITASSWRKWIPKPL